MRIERDVAKGARKMRDQHKEEYRSKKEVRNKEEGQSKEDYQRQEVVRQGRGTEPETPKRKRNKNRELLC